MGVEEGGWVLGEGLVGGGGRVDVDVDVDFTLLLREFCPATFDKVVYVCSWTQIVKPLVYFALKHWVSKKPLG